jgi:hypothetical protein
MTLMSDPSDEPLTYAASDVPCDLAVSANLDTTLCGHPLTAQRMVLKSCPTCPDDCVGHQGCLYHCQQVMEAGCVRYEQAP